MNDWNDLSLNMLHDHEGSCLSFLLGKNRTNDVVMQIDYVVAKVLKADLNCCCCVFE